MASFTYLPDYGASKSIAPNVQGVKFGDGYEQRAAYGLNTQPQFWDLKFSLRNTTDTAAIEAFLEDKGAVTAFQWTPPGESVERNFICKSWNKSLDAPNLATITARFEENFDP